MGPASKFCCAQANSLVGIHHWYTESTTIWLGVSLHLHEIVLFSFCFCGQLLKLGRYFLLFGPSMSISILHEQLCWDSVFPSICGVLYVCLASLLYKIQVGPDHIWLVFGNTLASTMCVVPVWECCALTKWEGEHIEFNGACFLLLSNGLFDSYSIKSTTITVCTLGHPCPLHFMVCYPSLTKASSWSAW